MERDFFYRMTRPTPQREWIEGRGVLLWLAFFFIELGAGLYFVSIFFNNLWGMLFGWLMCLIIGGGTHLAFLGKPLRFWRAFLKPQTSWVSRGMIFIGVFAVAGAVHLAFRYWAPDANVLGLKILLGIISLATVIYGGFVLSSVSALALWNNGLIPIMFVAVSLWGGAELLLGIMLATGKDPGDVEVWVRVLLVSFALIFITYLWSVAASSVSGKRSVTRLLKGDLAPLFYIGVVLVGLIFPIVVVTRSFAVGVGGTPAALLVAAILCDVLGDLAMRYCILRGGLYTPMVHAAASQT